MDKKLRVLVIDDSTFNRTTISKIINSHPDLEVVGMAEDGEKGLKEAAHLRPDLITLDIEMPRMDGFTFLRLLMSQMPTPVIMISSHSRKQEVFQALELGALDFVAKPARYFTGEQSALKDELISKALAVRSLQIVPLSRRASTRPSAAAVSEVAKPRRRQARGPVVRVVAIGASTGGPPALQSLFYAQGPGGGTAFVVAQHMPEKFTRAFAERLDRLARLDIREAEDGASLQSDCVYIAPGGHDLTLERGSEGAILRVRESTGEARYVPSIDRLFASVAVTFGAQSLAVVLTGMGSDGKRGVRHIHDVGGRVVVESQETAIVFGMPKEAIQTGCVDEVLPLERIIERVHAFAFPNMRRLGGA